MEAKYCIGKRYNFKKGFEYCTNRNQCKLYNDYIADEKKPEYWDDPNNYNSLEINFKTIKDFRKCKKHLIISSVLINQQIPVCPHEWDEGYLGVHRCKVCGKFNC